ncbi:MAG: efflux RND transporter periplasmic adaptor subunit [Pseudomonadales bacterium]
MIGKLSYLGQRSDNIQNLQVPKAFALFARQALLHSTGSARVTVRCRLQYVVAALFLVHSASAEEPLPAIDCLIEPNQTIELSTAVTGVIEDVTVDRGDYVTKDQIVARLNSDVEKALVELAKARAEFDGDIKLREENRSYTQRNQQRVAKLYKNKAISFQQKDETDTQWRLAKLELNKAKQQQRINALEYAHAVANLKQRTTTSPIDGVVVKRFLFPGEYVENRPIISIAEINPLRVEVVAPVSLFGKIAVGDRAKIELETANDKPLFAEVIMVDKVIDAASGTYGIRLTLPNGDNQIPRGLRCQAHFLTKQAKQSLSAK